MRNLPIPLFLLALLWLCTFLLSLPILMPYELARLGAVLLCMSAFLFSATRIIQNGLRLEGTPALDTALLFWCLALASTFWSPSFQISFIAFSTFCLLPLSFFAFSLSWDTHKVYMPVLSGLLMIITSLAAYAHYQYFFQPHMLVYGNVRIPFNNPNSFASLLSLGFFIALGLLFSCQKSFLKHLALLACILIITAILLTGSRGALICLALAAIIFLVLCPQRNIRWLIPYTVIGLSLIVTLLVLPHIHESGNIPLERLTSLTSGSYTSADARMDIWRSTWELISAAPLTGTGIGTFFLYYPALRASRENASSGYMAHNDPLQFFSEMGLLAPFLLYVFVLLLAWRVLQFKKRQPSSSQSPLVYALFSGVGAMFAHAHFSFPLYVASILLIAGILSGIIFSLTSNQEPDPIEFQPLTKKIGLLCVVLVLLTQAYILQGYLRSDYYIRLARTSLTEENIDRFAYYVNKADKVAFNSNARAYQYAAMIPLGILDTQPDEDERQHNIALPCPCRKI
jgi:O-antigen ligase